MSIKTKKGGKAIAIDEWKFTNQNWKGVLNEISNYAPNRYGKGKQNYGEDHPLVKRLKIKPHELMLIMSFLEDQGLIKYNEPEYNWINLTSKGFDVSLQNQSATSTVKINRAIIFLTAVIAIVALANVILSIDDPILKWAVTGVIAVGLISIAALIKKM